MENGPLIVDLPSKNGYVKLPDGTVGDHKLTDWDSLHQNTGMLIYEPAVIGLKQNGGYQSGWNSQPTRKDDQPKHKKVTPFLFVGHPSNQLWMTITSSCGK